MVKNIEARLDRLKRSIPRPVVWNMCQTGKGWTDHCGVIQWDSHSEGQANDFLKPCKTVIVVDV